MTRKYLKILAKKRTQKSEAKKLPQQQQSTLGKLSASNSNIDVDTFHLYSDKKKSLKQNYKLLGSFRNVIRRFYDILRMKPVIGHTVEFRDRVRAKVVNSLGSSDKQI